MKKNLQLHHKTSYNDCGLKNPVVVCIYAKNIIQSFQKWLGRSSYTIPSNREGYSHHVNTMFLTAQPPIYTLIKRLGWTVKTSVTAIAVSVCFSPLFKFNRGIKS